MLGNPQPPVQYHECHCPLGDMLCSLAIHEFMHYLIKWVSPRSALVHLQKVKRKLVKRRWMHPWKLERTLTFAAEPGEAR